MSERFEAARAALDLALPAARVAAGSGAPFALHTCATLLVQRAYVDDREGDAAGAAACLVEARALGLDESNASEWLGATPTVLAVFERLK